MTSERIEREARTLWRGDPHDTENRTGLQVYLLANGYDAGVTVDMESLLIEHIAAAIERIVKECADVGGAAEASQADHDAAIAAAYEAAAQHAPWSNFAGCMCGEWKVNKSLAFSDKRSWHEQWQDHICSLATQSQRDALAHRIAVERRQEAELQIEYANKRIEAEKAQAVNDALDQLPHTFIGAGGGHFSCAVPYDPEHDQFTCLKCQAVAKVKEGL